MIVFYQLRNIVFVDICDFGEDQITFHDQFKQKTVNSLLTFSFHCRSFDHVDNLEALEMYVLRLTANF